MHALTGAFLMNNQSYNIVYCTPALYSAGGTERAVTFKANFFADVLGYHVTIIVTEGNGRNSFFPLSEKVKVVNFALGFEDIWNISFFKKVWLYLMKQKKYRKLLKNELLSIKPDITITTLRREVNFLDKIGDGSCKVGELHLSRDNYRGIERRKNNYIVSLFYKWWKKKIVRQLQGLDKIVLLTKCAAQEWPELNNIRVIPDPLPLNVLKYSSLYHKRIITVGRYSFEKGYDLLLRAWSMIEKECDDWELDVYGMGDPTPYVKIMDELSIDPRRCRLNSSIVNVEKEYLKSSILVQPSRTEGFGLVLIEAMSCGVPVISFDCENGPRSIITDGVDGFLIPPFDIEAFAEKVVLLMKDGDLRKQMGEEARKSTAKYDIDTVGSQWKQLFDELMKKI